MQSTVKCIQGCSSSHSRCFCGQNHCDEHCPVPPRCLCKNLLSRWWGILPNLMTERCRHTKVWSSQTNTEPPRGAMGLTKAITGFGSASFSACFSFPPLPYTGVDSLIHILHENSISESAVKGTQLATVTLLSLCLQDPPRGHQGW